MAAVVSPGLEMVADKDRVEALALGFAGEVEQFLRSELFGGCLVA
jgi:hypothetical protein